MKSLVSIGNVIEAKVHLWREQHNQIILNTSEWGTFLEGTQPTYFKDSQAWVLNEVPSCNWKWTWSGVAETWKIKSTA